MMGMRKKMVLKYLLAVPFIWLTSPNTSKACFVTKMSRVGCLREGCWKGSTLPAVETGNAAWIWPGGSFAAELLGSVLSPLVRES